MLGNRIRFSAQEVVAHFIGSPGEGVIIRKGRVFVINNTHLKVCAKKHLNEQQQKLKGGHIPPNYVSFFIKQVYGTVLVSR